MMGASRGGVGLRQRRDPRPHEPMVQQKKHSVPWEVGGCIRAGLGQIGEGGTPPFRNSVRKARASMASWRPAARMRASASGLDGRGEGGWGWGFRDPLSEGEGGFRTPLCAPPLLAIGGKSKGGRGGVDPPPIPHGDWPPSHPSPVSLHLLLLRERQPHPLALVPRHPATAPSLAYMLPGPHPSMASKGRQGGKPAGVYKTKKKHKTVGGNPPPLPKEGRFHQPPPPNRHAAPPFWWKLFS